MCLCVGVEGYCIISVIHNAYVSMVVCVWEWEEGGGGAECIFLFVCM